MSPVPLIPLLVACALASGVHAAPVSGLHDVAVEIADRSPAERARASRVALETVLVRITGLAALPESEALRAALTAPDRYAIQYGLDERPTATGTQTLLTVRFAEASLVRLVDEAGLPLWSTNRPTFLVWGVVDERGSREVLGADAKHPFVRALVERSAFRGLPVVLPAMDLDDALAVSPAVIWSGMTDELVAAASRYGAEGVLVVRLTADPRGFWRTRWQMRLADGEEMLEWTTPTPEGAAQRVVDQAADSLVARFSVAAGARQDLRVRVDGLAGFADYVAVLAYLRGLEFVDDVRVEALERSSVDLAIVTRTPWDRFRDLLDLDGRLAVQGDAIVGSGAVPLLWQGGEGR